MSDQLAEYRRKRNPEKTPEPFGGQPSAGSGLFVIQKHAARALHYDLRLEIGGVLKSWAVPKGPSIRSHEKRLAVQVEDHPIEYADFEGIIPKDNYGAGAVIVWDHGTYRLVNARNPREQVEKGTLEFELRGYKLHGLWMLVRMSGSGKNWLLFSKNPATDRPEPVDEQPESILSGLTVEERRAPDNTRAKICERLAQIGATVGVIEPRQQGFMLASANRKAFTDKAWLFEIKYDGVRVFAHRGHDQVTLYGRKGHDITRQYPEIANALNKTATREFLIDGEIIATDETGRPNFQRLQKRMHRTKPLDLARAKTMVPVRAVFFDCLWLEAHDLRTYSLSQRKECLRSFLPPRGVIQYCEHIMERGEDFYHAAWENHLEGIVGKRVSSRYTPGRSQEWLKFKCQLHQEFVIGGYTDPGGSRGYFGALHLGLYENGNLVYVAKVGTGFNNETLKAIATQLASLTRASSPFVSGGPTGPLHHWVEPELVCEIRFTEWTTDGGLRHPSFLGLRNDKNPEDCIREASPQPEELESQRVPHPFEITNPTKVFWPIEGYTKTDLLDYYEQIAPYLLPYLEERPLVLTRFPDGIDGKSFFQKDAPEFVPDWVTTSRIYSKDAQRDIHYFIVNNLETLRYVVNLGTIPLHVWASRLSALDRPDWLVLDLDPKGAPFTEVVRVARMFEKMLRELELVSYVKTSGATGLHILLPMAGQYTYEECRHFARLLAIRGQQQLPDIATIARPIRAREGKVYIDFGQNGHGRTIAAPFSVRPLPAAPVSCPLRWSEVTARLDPERYTIKTAPKRFDKIADPLLPVFGEGIDMARALALAEGLFGG